MGIAKLLNIVVVSSLSVLSIHNELPSFVSPPKIVKLTFASVILFVKREIDVVPSVEPSNAGAATDEGVVSPFLP